MTPEEEVITAQPIPPPPAQPLQDVVVDKYPPSTHMDNSTRMYGAPYHAVAGAIAYGQSKYPDKHGSHFSIDEVKQLLEEFLAQEHKGEKKLIEERGY